MTAITGIVLPVWDKIECTRVMEPGGLRCCWVKVSDEHNLKCEYFHVWVVKIGDEHHCPRCSGWFYNLSSLGPTLKSARITRCDHVCHSISNAGKFTWFRRYVIARFQLFLDARKK